MFNTKEEENQGGDGTSEDPDNNGGAGKDDADRMFQQEEQEANDAYEEPGEDEVFEENEAIWTIFEDDENMEEDSDIEEGHVELYWSMIDKDTVGGISPTKAIQQLADVKVSQKRKIAETQADSSATEVGCSLKKSKECNETDNSNGASSGIKPVESLTDETEKESDDKIGQGKPQLTWAEVLTAAFPKNIFTQLRLRA